MMDRPDLVAAPVKSRRVPGVPLDGPREEVVRLLLARTWDASMVNVRAFMERGDPGYLHLFRVALRRCRVYERDLAAPLGPDVRAALTSPMRQLFRASNALRDLHALQSSDDPVSVEIREAASVDALAAMHRAARTSFEDALRAEKCFLLGETMRALPFANAREKPRDFGRFLSRRVERRLERTRELGGGICASSPDAAFHRVRRSAKALRYLNDVLRLRGEKRAERVQAETTRLQEALGAYQDFIVAESLARSLGVEIPGAPAARLERRQRAVDVIHRFIRRSRRLAVRG
jgi:CHAD domain-containing protein